MTIVSESSLLLSTVKLAWSPECFGAPGWGGLVLRLDAELAGPAALPLGAFRTPLHVLTHSGVDVGAAQQLVALLLGRVNDGRLEHNHSLGNI